MDSDDEITQLLDRTVSPHPKFLGMVTLGGVIFLVVGLVFLFKEDTLSIQSPIQPSILGVSSTLPPFPSSKQLQEKYASSSSVGSVQSTIKINSASSDEIDSLPGIGSVRAQKIMENRPYKDASQLREKTGLSSSLLQKILPYVTFE